MPKVKVTYNAPKDDHEVVTMRGVRFFDGQAKELDADEHEHLVKKLRGNHHFHVEGHDAPAKAPAPVVEDGLKAVHNGGGRFIIKRGWETVKEGLNKSDADAFNAMSDEDKAEFVK